MSQRSLDNYAMQYLPPECKAISGRYRVIIWRLPSVTYLEYCIGGGARDTQLPICVTQVPSDVQYVTNLTGSALTSSLSSSHTIWQDYEGRPPQQRNRCKVNSAVCLKCSLTPH
jgi:hypothetical protein